MSKRNNNINKSKGSRSSLGGRTIPTPVADKKKKKAATSTTQVQINYDKCPCGEHDENSWVLKCTQCPQQWHSICANLRGIKQDFVEQLEEWLCPFCFSAPGVTQRQNQLLESLQLNIVSLTTKNTDLEQALKQMEDKLTSLISETGEVTETNKLISGKLMKLSDIETHIQHRTLQEGQVDEKLKVMNRQLDELKTSVEQLKNAPPPPVQQTPNTPPQVILSEPVTLTTPSSIKPATYTEEFIDATVVSSITEYLSSEGDFKEENGHSVQLFGHPYSYTGSKATSTEPEVPEPLKPIFEKLNQLQAEQFFAKYPDLKGKVTAPVLNSCLVNRYSGMESLLPEHSDNETTIHPESSIFTVSLGEKCQITFADKQSKSDVLTLTCDTGSLYSMTRRSQEFFSHRIDRGSVGDGVRYSLTFRSVNWRNRNSTLILGDSNTCKLTFGSDKRNSFGELMPGQQFYAPTLEKVDEVVSLCCGYNNVVFSCGINDLKHRNVTQKSDIDNIFQEYCRTISNIRRLNSKTNLFIVPILPTKSNEYNRKALYFNSRIFRDLDKLGLGVIHVDGIQGFVDSSGLLSQVLSRQFDRYDRIDLLHLNNTGVRRFAGLIKRAVFSRLTRGAEKRNGTSTPTRRRTGSPQNAAGLGVGGLSDGCQV